MIRINQLIANDRKHNQRHGEHFGQRRDVQNGEMGEERVEDGGHAIELGFGGTTSSEQSSESALNLSLVTSTVSYSVHAFVFPPLKKIEATSPMLELIR